MAQWLFKTEPNDYNWDQFVKDGQTEWDGVKNYQAANNMKAMKKGEVAFFYRSMKQPAIIGIMRVIGEAFPDPDDEKGKFVRVILEPVEALAREVSLKEIKSDDRLAEISLIRQSRLSVMPILDDHWKIIMDMSKS